ncbi:MAG: hypothetical protein C0490_13110 [Marivirga sp.]|nr:hypothetical protein [Marivirga sp.]
MLPASLSLISLFQKKLILPTLVVSVAIGVAGYFMLWSVPLIKGTGYGYLLAGPLIHYFIYEKVNPNEYYFYFNAGINKVLLWASTIIVNFTISSLILYYE